MGKKNKGNPASFANGDDETPVPVTKKQKGAQGHKVVFSSSLARSADLSSAFLVDGQPPKPANGKNNAVKAATPSMPHVKAPGTERAAHTLPKSKSAAKANGTPMPAALKRKTPSDEDNEEDSDVESGEEAGFETASSDNEDSDAEVDANGAEGSGSDDAGSEDDEEDGDEEDDQDQGNEEEDGDVDMGKQTAGAGTADSDDENDAAAKKHQREATEVSTDIVRELEGGYKFACYLVPSSRKLTSSCHLS